MKHLFFIAVSFSLSLPALACPLTDSSKRCLVELVKESIPTKMPWSYQISKEKCFPNGTFDLLLETELDSGHPVYLLLSADGEQLDRAELHYFPQHGDPIVDVNSCF